MSFKHLLNFWIKTNTIYIIYFYSNIESLFLTMNLDLIFIIFFQSSKMFKVESCSKQNIDEEVIRKAGIFLSCSFSHVGMQRFACKEDV